MRLVIVVILLLSSSACIQLGSEPQPQHYYLLTPRAEVSGSNQTPRDLIFDQIEFPSYLDRPQLVTRSLQNELEISARDRWGEPLQDNLMRVLKENLQRRMSGLRISSYPWQPTAEGGLLLHLTVNQFDGILGRQANVDIRWSLTETASDELVYQSHYIARLPIGNSSAELVAGLSKAVNQLSAEISQELTQIK